MEQRIRALEEALGQGTGQRNTIFSSTPDDRRILSPITPSSHAELNGDGPISLPQQTQPVDNVSLNLSCSLGSFPGSSITTLPRGPHPDHDADIISCGLISLEAAEEYFLIYQQSLDPYIHHVLARDDCLANVRARSPLLTISICAVGSFCAASTDFSKIYGAFTNEVSKRVFSRCNSFDDVRAVCIGAFWLDKISSTLVALGTFKGFSPLFGIKWVTDMTFVTAVRMAADLNLHRCITKMPHTKKECYERTRLYFLVYICDHHCSLVHGRPPVTREYRSLKNPQTFLQSEFCTSEDVKLISQVDFWSISTQVFDVFGADVEASVGKQRAATLQSLGVAYDQWRAHTLDIIDDDLDDFSQQRLSFYANCGNLYLFSHAFRGPVQRRTKSTTSKELEKFQHRALENALAIVQSAVSEREIQQRLQYLPSYFITMIVFASIFLMKVSGQEETALGGMNKNQIGTALTNLVHVFRTPSASLSPQHPLLSVTKSLEIAISRYRCQLDVDNFNDSFNNTTDSIDDTLFGFGEDFFSPGYSGEHDDHSLLDSTNISFDFFRTD